MSLRPASGVWDRARLVTAQESEGICGRPRPVFRSRHLMPSDATRTNLRTACSSHPLWLRPFHPLATDVKVCLVRPRPSPTGSGLAREAGRPSQFGYREAVAKKTKQRAGAVATAERPSIDRPDQADNPRRPCPCGSGRRYKACHGSSDAADMIVARPFAGLAAETELIALREFVPSATAPLTLLDPPDDAPSITLCTVLPGAAAALTREDRSVLLGLQVQTHSGDLSRDLAASLEWALTAAPSSALSAVGRATVGKRLGDLVVDEPLDVSVHDSFGWWLETEPEPGSDVAVQLERANSAIMPTARLGDLVAAYWVDAGEKAHLRWVRAEDESVVMDALARLSAADRLDLGEGSRYVGSFRAHGRLVPVWDLDREAHPTEWEKPAAAFGERFDAAAAQTEPLTAAERRARDGLLGRQFTLR